MNRRQFVAKSRLRLLRSRRGGRSRFHLSTRLRCHDREKDFDYPRYLLIHTRPGSRSLFGAEFGTADRFPCCDGPYAHQLDARLISFGCPTRPQPWTKTWKPRWRSVLRTRLKGGRGHGIVHSEGGPQDWFSLLSDLVPHGNW